MHSVSFYHLLAMIYTVCFTTYYIPEHSVLCNIALKKVMDILGERIAAFYHLNMSCHENSIIQDCRLHMKPYYANVIPT